MKARYWFALAAAGAAALYWKRRARNPRNFRLQLEPGTEPAGDPEGSIEFIGTATTLIRFGGMTILTDPNFLHRMEQVHIGYGMHSTRLTEPSMSFDDLPYIDFVILSHMHEDHFDKRVQERLDRNVPILTTESAARSLREIGFARATGLSTWDRVTVTKGDTSLTITSMPARHGPLLVSALAMPSVMGSMLEFRNRAGEYRLYISGDTLVYNDIEEIPHRYPDIDLALLHLGGTRVLGILVTMDAAQGIRMMEIVHPKRAIPIHYDDYDVFKDSLENFKRAVVEAGLQQKVRYLDRGDRYEFSTRAAHELEDLRV
ncbi:MAG TPA: MBL fold metallo-hydrolase [Candidatus Limnocylindrales bacterium]|nr:MBL fold metallo-hydrolase [Candidatus Limnocylindrales bacterium]